MKSFFSKYHKGERLAQEKAGEIKQAAFNGQAISNEIIDGAISFIAEQEYVIASITDDNNRVWSTVIIGKTGFITAKDKKTLIVDLSSTLKSNDDPFWSQLKAKKKIGFVIIELASRRRLRVNGSISKINDSYFYVRVKESYPNCMKYIQRRQITYRENIHTVPSTTKGSMFAKEQLEIIQKSDTFFIGSNNPKGDLDVSHRGGSPGFISIVDNKTMRVPDYKGNSMFNTFGNLMVDNRAGLVFWDFTRGIILQMTGTVTIDWNYSDPDNETNVTRRFWEFRVQEWIQYYLCVKHVWEFLDYSPNNPK